MEATGTPLSESGVWGASAVIFATVGNATQGFRRFLEAVDALAGESLGGREQVLIQTGHNPDFTPRHCQAIPFLSMNEFQQWMKKADLIICHAGAGTLLYAVQLEKVPVAMPRLVRYNEHVNDHQVQLVEAFAAEGRIVPAYEPGELAAAVAEARRRGARPPVSAPSKMIRLIDEAVRQLVEHKL